MIPRRKGWGRCERRGRVARDHTGSTITLSGFRDQVRGEQNLVIIFGAEIRGGDIASLVKFGSGIAGAKFLCLADYANSRGAADMGLYPDSASRLPSHHRVRKIS